MARRAASHELGCIGGSSSGAVFAAAEVDLADFYVGLYVVEFSFAQDGALVEDGDFAAAGDLFYESHVVLDDDDAVFAGEGEEQFPGAMSLVVCHAGGGFVNEKNLRVLGEEHADFEPLLLAMAEAAGDAVTELGEADGFEDLLDAVLSDSDAVVAADFEAFAAAQRQVAEIWRQTEDWTHKTILNTVNMGWFSSDRTIREYAADIWNMG